MADREDSWVTGLYKNKDGEEDAAESATTTDPTHQAIMAAGRRRAVHLEDVEEEEEEEEATETEPAINRTAESTVLSQVQKAPVFTKAEDRGPNLNVRAGRRQAVNNDFEFDWDIPEYEEEVPVYQPPPPSLPPPTPPPSNGGSPIPETPPPRDHVFDPTEYEKQLEADDYDRKIKEINDSKWADKPLTRWVGDVVVKKTQRAVYKENTEQVQEGLKVVETLTEKPLNKFFSVITTLLPYIVFAISVIASIIDIIRSEVLKDAHNRGLGYSCFTLDLVDVVLLTLNGLLHLLPWYKRKTEAQRESFEKRQQLIDNILAEALLYPSILCSLISVATDRVFEENLSDSSAIGYDIHVGILDLVLITFDIASLLYVYVSRMYIVHRFLSNLNAMFPDATEQDSRFAVTSRIFYTIVLNALLFGMMIMHLGLQVYHENLEENKPPEHGAEIIYMSYVAATMLLATIIVPIYSIVVFILANYYYILELMIKINLHVVKKADCRKKLEEHGDVAKGIMGFAGKNVHATPGRLRDIQTLSTFQRVFYVLREWWIDMIFFVWAVLIVGYCVLFYDYYSNHVSLSTYDAKTTSAQETFSIIYICSFMLCASLFVLGNYHSFAVVIITNLIMIPLFISFAIQAAIDKCQEVAGKNIEREKDKFAGIVTLIGKNNNPTPEPIKTRPPTGYNTETHTSHGMETHTDTLLRPPTGDKDRPATQNDISRPPTQSELYRPLTQGSDSRPPTVMIVTPRPSTNDPENSKSKPFRPKTSVSSIAISMTSVEEPDGETVKLSTKS